MPVPMLTAPQKSPRERRQVRAYDIADEHVVTGLQSVADNRHVRPRQQLFREDGHHAGLAVRVLARPVDVRVAKRDVWEADDRR